MAICPQSAFTHTDVEYSSQSKPSRRFLEHEPESYGDYPSAIRYWEPLTGEIEGFQTDLGYHEFINPIKISVHFSRDDNAFIARAKSIGVVGYGISFEAALDDFVENIDYLWTSIISADDSELSSHAQKLKQVFLANLF